MVAPLHPVRSPVLLAILLAVAGCVAPGSPGAQPDLSSPRDPSWALHALASGEGHDHANLSQHEGLSTPNFEIVGWDPLVSPDTGRTAGGHFCGDAQDVAGGRRLAAVEQRTVGGFVLADVTDPEAPRRLGEFVMRNSRLYDLALTPDGGHVVLVTTDEVRLPSAGLAAEPVLEWRSPCAPSPVALLAPEDPLPRPSSVVLVDVRDPAQPRVIDQHPLPTNGHSVVPAPVDGRTLLLVAALAPDNGYYRLYELLDTPLGKRLGYLSTMTIDTNNPPPNHGRSMAHDGWIAKHPVTGQTLAYLAGGRDLALYDLADPRVPRLVGTWSDWAPDRDGFTGHLHSVVPLPQTWNDRHYTLLGPEYGGHPDGQPSGTLWVLDTTDPARMRAVGAWTLPHEVEWSDVYQFSNHYFTVHNRTAFVSMYHGGVWAVDLRPALDPTGPPGAPEDPPGSGEGAGPVRLPSVGVFLADRVSPSPPETMLRWTPTAQEVHAFPDGILVVFDGSSGVYTLRFDEARPAPAPEPWPTLPPPRG